MWFFAGIPAFLQEKRSHIIAETISKAWHQPDLERRLARGARMLRAVYETTPEQTIHFSSVVANNDGDICYFGKTTDAHQTSELVFAFFEHGAKCVRYNLELTDGQVYATPQARAMSRLLLRTQLSAETELPPTLCPRMRNHALPEE